MGAEGLPASAPVFAFGLQALCTNVTRYSGKMFEDGSNQRFSDMSLGALLVLDLFSALHSQIHLNGSGLTKLNNVIFSVSLLVFFFFFAPFSSLLWLIFLHFCLCFLLSIL